MSKEPEKKAAEQGGSEIEYAFGRVPADKRKTFSTILVILVGYCISLSNFVTGATVSFIKARTRSDFDIPWVVNSSTLEENSRYAPASTPSIYFVKGSGNKLVICFRSSFLCHLGISGLRFHTYFISALYVF